MKLHLRSVALALLLLPALFSQAVPAFRADVNLVTVPCVVTDRHGVGVSGLQPDDFRLYADGVRQDIRNLWSETDLPLILGVIIDVSESQKDNVTRNEAAVDRFLERIIRPRDRAFVVAVNENVILKSEVTGGPYGLRHIVLPARENPLGAQCGALHGEHGCGGTALWNAVYASARLKLNQPGVSRALLILSDGDDTGSTHKLSDAIEEVQRSGTVAYAIRYPNSPGGSDADNGLSRLTDETGGILFDSAGAKYPEILARIEADLRSRYIIGFRPGAVDGKRHLLRVEGARPELTIRARRNYFDR
jgi:VWFA-related protein